LEPLGFIKFDVLGLTTLAIMEGAIYHILRRHYKIASPTFDQIRDFYEKNLHPDKIDLSDQNVYKDIFQAGKWAGIFQFANEGAQKLCSNSKVESIIDLSAVTSIYRPGPLSAGVDRDYIEAKESPQYIKYDHPIIRKILEPTYGFMIFQEQIAQLAAELGKDLTLDDGNKLRKLLTKKGLSEKKMKEKENIKQRFLEGCYEKGYKNGEELWRKFEYFSGYGFNKCLAFSELVNIYDTSGKKICKKQVKDVVPGDIVRSRDEKTAKDIFIPVKKNHYNGKKKVYSFELSDGRKIKCTMDHKFRTKCGKMMPIKEIMKSGLEMI
jgi:DNA polymerase-3 subunit alpha